MKIVSQIRIKEMVKKLCRVFDDAIIHTYELSDVKEGSVHS